MDDASSRRTSGPSDARGLFRAPEWGLVVGGCSLSGGVGSIRGTVLGLILLQIVIKGTSQVATSVSSTSIEGLVLGTVVVLAVAFNQRFRGRG